MSCPPDLPSKRVPRNQFLQFRDAIERHTEVAQRRGTADAGDDGPAAVGVRRR
jgi:hypothetical protein